MGGLRRERSSKWCQCFRYTTAVMYMVDCSTFDVPLQEDSTKVYQQIDKNLPESRARCEPSNLIRRLQCVIMALKLH